MLKNIEQNPKGLHIRYNVSKPDGSPVDESAEYFVLRLDDETKDKLHLVACRKAIKTYAEEIRDHLPELAEDIIKRYVKN